MPWHGGVPVRLCRRLTARQTAGQRKCGIVETREERDTNMTREVEQAQDSRLAIVAATGDFLDRVDADLFATQATGTRSSFGRERARGVWGWCRVGCSFRVLSATAAVAAVRVRLDQVGENPPFWLAWAEEAHFAVDQRREAEL